MAKFIPNAIGLYREGGDTLLDGKMIDCKVFDMDSPTFKEDSTGWVTHEQMWSTAPLEPPFKKK
jgi:hypothetical protein